jgi:hypothetical protein
VAHLRQIVTLDQKIVVAQFALNLPETALLQVAHFSPDYPVKKQDFKFLYKTNGFHVPYG